MNQLTSSRHFSVLFLALALALFAFSLTARAVTPAPDGGYANQNTAEGDSALFSVTTGFSDTAVGFEALFSNSSGAENTATGYRALNSNTTGTRNTATGDGALARNTTGGYDTATGLHALFINATGHHNTANGVFALSKNTTGSNNIALGANAGISLTTGNNNIEIGNAGLAGETNAIRIGATGTQTATYIAGIYGVTEPSGVSVVVGPDGHLGTVTSSARFKEAVKPMDKVSEAILALEPVTFRYKHDLDSAGIRQFGLIAEQVEKVNPDLVSRGADGKVYSVRYDAVNAMLLNEFLKEHSQVQRLEATVAQQQEQIEALTATVQKVSDQAAFSKPAPQLVANP
jgi:Chaperone of endosialidase